MSAGTDALATRIAAVTEAVRSACSDPADAIRLLSELATFVPTEALDPAQVATAALCRGTALVSLARACATCQPTSYDDAIAIRTAVAGIFDAEALAAADAGQGALYLSLRVLRNAVVVDLSTRAAALASLRTVTTPTPTPSLVLAYALYGDATRADDLTARADVPHPGFLPTSFLALSA